MARSTEIRPITGNDMTLAMELTNRLTRIGRSFCVKVGGFALAVGVLSACAQSSGDAGLTRASFDELQTQLYGHWAGCTETYDVEPRKLSGIGENELAVGEREWLECAYQGIESIMIPGSSVPDMYRQLISDSRSMTDLVEQGRLTRTKRGDVLQVAIDEIESAEILAMARGGTVTAADLKRARLARRAFDGMSALTFPSPL